MTDGGESAAVSFFGVSDVGLVRKSNEDAFGVFGAGGAHLGEAGRVAGGGDLIAVVSDGVGGHDAGEVASAAAVASLGAGLGQLAVGGVAEEAVPGALRGLLDGLNRHLRSFSKNRGQDKRMAATATAAWLGRGRLAVAHVGDSRVYRWRGGRLTCLTVDDTEAARAVAEGRITPEQARTHAKKHVLERAVGMDPQKFASLAEIHAVEDGDVYLLCSDGLTDGLSDQQLERGFEGLDPSDLAAFAERLVEAGNRASGKDNLTAVLLAVGPGWVKASRRAAPPPTPVSASRLSTLSGDSIMQAFSRSAWPLWGAVGILFLTMLGLTWQARRARADLVATIAELQGVIQQADAPSVGDPPLGDSVDSVADTPPEGATPTETTALASPAEAGAPQPPSVLLRIDPADAGARVWLGAEADVAVGADGTLRFEAFPLGKHELVVQAPGYQPVVTRVEVGAAGLEETVRLVPVRGSVELRMQNEELRSGTGVVLRVDGREQSGAWRDGVLRLEGLEVGRRALEVTHPSYRTDRTDLTVTDQRTSTYEVRLAPLPGRITLEVSGPRAGEWSVEVDGEAVEPSSGNVLELAAQREHVVRVSARGWQALEQRVTLGAAEQRRLTFRLEEARGPVPGQNAEVELPGGVKMSFTWVRAMNLWVGTYEVTNAEFRAFRSGHDSGNNFNGARQPVVRVRYEDAVAFCDWLTERERTAGRLPAGYRYRLASGDEWTRFARCGTNREFPWGDSMPPTRGNYSNRISNYNSGAGRTVNVEDAGENEWGLYGVGGNVWEWTSEQRGSSRVARGGSWSSVSEFYLRVADSSSDHPSYRFDRFGFRVLLGPAAGGG